MSLSLIIALSLIFATFGIMAATSLLVQPLPVSWNRNAYYPEERNN